MLCFDPLDPFPWFAAGVHSYQAEKEHAREVDAWLGLAIEKTEAGVAEIEGREIWRSHGPDTFLTPVTEIRRMLELLQPKGKVVDLGAGYGRMGFVMARHFPQAEFLGYEIVRERVDEGNRALRAFGANSARLIEADLREVVPADAEIYFLYDYGKREAIEKTLLDLQRIARRRTVTIVGRGRAVRDRIERKEPWLTVLAPEHHGNFSIYRSA